MALPPNLITNKTARLPGDYQKQVSAALQPKRKKQDLEQKFLDVWMAYTTTKLIGFDPPVREFRFVPPRRWRFDFAFPNRKVAVEIEGLVSKWNRHEQGHHQTTEGYRSDCEKYREASKLGWLVLRYTGQELVQRPVQIVEEVVEVLKQRSDGA